MTASVSKRMSISAWPAVPTSWCCTSIEMPTCSSTRTISERRSWNESIGGTGKYPSLYRGLYAEVRAAVELEVAARVPHALDRVEEVVARVLVLVEARRVEDVELGLGPEVRGVGEAGALEVVLGLLRDVARVTAVALAGDRVLHERVDVQRLVLAERVDDRGLRVRASGACPTPGSPGTRGSTSRRSRGRPRTRPRSARAPGSRSAASGRAGRRSGCRRRRRPRRLTCFSTSPGCRHGASSWRVRIRAATRLLPTHEAWATAGRPRLSDGARLSERAAARSR